MVHDLSIAVVGPAVHDLYDTFRLYWNEDIPELEKLPTRPFRARDRWRRRHLQGAGGAYPQRERFSELGGTSEKGIMEAYLRAFAAAESDTDLENQYFTDSVITDALVEVLKKKPNLELILVVPIKPDVHLLPAPAGLADRSSSGKPEAIGSASSLVGPTTRTTPVRGSRRSTSTPRAASWTTPGPPSGRRTSTGSRSTTTCC